jgi:repressor LexA
MNRIKDVLEDKGIKQTWLAEKLNKSYNMVNAYVQNRRQPSLELLFEIASILQVEARDLLDDNQTVYNNTSQSDTINIPLIGSVACGLPMFAEEHIEAQIPIATKLVKTPSDYFLLRASGDSMNLKGIDSGDLLLIKRQNTAETGDLVLALLDDEATVKEFKHNGSTIVLKPHSSNLKHQPIILTSDFKVQGVVAHVVKM